MKDTINVSKENYHLIERVLSEVFGMEWYEIHEEAERLWGAPGLAFEQGTGVGRWGFPRNNEVVPWRSGTRNRQIRLYGANVHLNYRRGATHADAGTVYRFTPAAAANPATWPDGIGAPLFGLARLSSLALVASE